MPEDVETMDVINLKSQILELWAILYWKVLMARTYAYYNLQGVAELETVQGKCISINRFELIRFTERERITFAFTSCDTRQRNVTFA